MPLSICSPILKGISAKEFIESLAEDAFHNYIRDNKLMPKKVRFPSQNDFWPTPEEGLENLKLSIKSSEEELQILEAKPLDELIKEQSIDIMSGIIKARFPTLIRLFTSKCLIK